jgi:BirA family biotin operon repressor/biotin-[acetyl-CoA-carboxylase] ligase
VILGFGINVLPASYPPEVASRATSIEAELGRPVERSSVLTECLAALAERYEDLHQRRGGAVLVAWRAYALPMMGREVEWTGRHGIERGYAHDVDETGALVVRCAYGVTRVISGEVRWL